MRAEMTCQERLMATINFEPTDRVPIVFRDARPLEHNWTDPVSRAAYLLGLGIDDVISFGTPRARHPEVTEECWHEETEAYPILHKRYDTPAGPLHMAARLSEDWQVDDLPLIADQLWARTIEPLIKNDADLDALDYVLYDPRQANMDGFREQITYYTREAQRLGVPVMADLPAAPGHVFCFLTAKRMMLTIRDNPEFVREVLRRTQVWTRANLELLLDLGVDIIYYSGCYETVDFWSPTDVRELFLPLVAENVRIAHQAGAKFHYFTQTGSMPFLDDYAQMGVDMLSALDNYGTNGTDPVAAKQLIGDRVCLMGGVDPREPFERRTPEYVRQVTLEMVRAMAPGGGYILSTTGSFQVNSQPENIMAFIKWGLQYGRYPLDLPDA